MSELRTWKINITEVRPAQYSLTLIGPKGDEYTVPKVLGAMRVLGRIDDFVKRLIFMNEPSTD